MKELDELDKQKSLYQLMTKLNEAETSIREKRTISADELEAELGVSDWNKLKFGGWYPHEKKTHQGLFSEKCIQAPLRATCPTAIAVYTRDVVRLSASELVSAAHIPLCTSLSYRADDRTWTCTGVTH